ncbi:MAG: hypothetical protein JW861_11305 [Bacteroidales bacterium]|nr:hypothetical protein [Bacteroidales bacterium]
MNDPESREQTFRVLSVNISLQKGTVKRPVEKICITPSGVEGDAHAGDWHRQVSLLGAESIRKFSCLAGREIGYGEFAENITTEGMVLYETSPLDRFRSGEVLLEVTQIGKKCHGDSCAIFREVGACVMPKEGIFCRVIRPGMIRPGDPIEFIPRVYRIHIITLSDRASRGEYEDRSGPRIEELLRTFFDHHRMMALFTREVIPDDASLLRESLNTQKQACTDLIFTTGGTGIGPRDITPDVARDMIDREIPGIMELIRYKYGSEKPNALLSRSIAGVMGSSLVYCLPGSVRAVTEYIGEIQRTIRHSIMMLHGIDMHG